MAVTQGFNMRFFGNHIQCWCQHDVVFQSLTLVDGHNLHRIFITFNALFVFVSFTQFAIDASFEPLDLFLFIIMFPFTHLVDDLYQLQDIGYPSFCLSARLFHQFGQCMV